MQCLCTYSLSRALHFPLKIAPISKTEFGMKKVFSQFPRDFTAIGTRWPIYIYKLYQLYCLLFKLNSLQFDKYWPVFNFLHATEIFNKYILTKDLYKYIFFDLQGKWFLHMRLQKTRLVLYWVIELFRGKLIKSHHHPTLYKDQQT